MHIPLLLLSYITTDFNWKYAARLHGILQQTLIEESLVIIKRDKLT